MVFTRRLHIMLLACALGAFISGFAGAEGHSFKLGMSGAFSGGNASMGEDFSTGLKVGFEHYQTETGNHVQLITLDDGYEPGRAAPNVRSLIEEQHVDALIGNIGTPTAVVSAPIAMKEKTLLFAPVTGSSLIRPVKPDRYIINYRASYNEEINAVLHAILQKYSLTAKDIALFSQQDTFGDGGRKYITALLSKYGITTPKGLFQIEYPRNTLSVEYAVADLLVRNPTPKVIFMLSSAAPSVKFIKLVHQYGLDPLFVGISFVGNRYFAKELADIPARILISQVVPPHNDASIPLVDEFQQDMRKYTPQKDLNALSLEGYIAARIFTKAMPQQAHLDREEIINALESLGQFDIGLGVPLTLSASEHQASHSVWLTQLVKGTYQPVSFQEAAILYGQSAQSDQGKP